MKRTAWFAAVGTMSLLTTSCSKNETGDAEASLGGSVSANRGAGGSRMSSGSGGSSPASSSRVVDGTGGSSRASAATAIGGSINVGGTAATNTAVSSSSGGLVANTSVGNPSASGGTSNAGGASSMAKGGTTASGSTKGGTAGTNGSVVGGRPSAGGAIGIAGTPSASGSGSASAKGGASGANGSGVGGKASAGGANGTAGAPAGAPGTPSSGCGKTTSLTSARASIDVSGKAREYILALPKNYDPNRAYKLVFAWHPWTGSAQQIASGGYYGLQKESNNEAIFVAAEGLNFTQGGQSGLGWGNADGEDVAFYHSMLDRFRSELCIDEERIFSVGFSFGAMFSFTLGCTAESMTRAIVPMAGNTFTSGGCANGTRSVAVMAFIGLQDSLLDGHRQAVTTYTKRDGCTATTVTMNPSWCDGLAAKNQPCTCVSYQGCKDGYPVISCEYTAGHQQAPNPGPIWDFLEQF